MRRAAPRLVVFDCDGTLVDSQGHIIATMNEAFRRHDLAAPPAASVRGVIGLSLPLAIAALAPDQATERLERIEQSYREAFFALRQRDDYHEPLFDGVGATLDALEADGFLLGIATGKNMRGLRATLERHGLLSRFVTLQTADRAPSKPHPAMVEQAMAEAGAEPASTVLVGDTTFDIEMARNAGIAAVGVAWGYHELDRLRAAGAHRIIETFGQLPGVVGELLGGT